MGPPKAITSPAWSETPLLAGMNCTRCARVVVEPRDRSSTGQVTAMGARVVAESPLKRMYGRAELFPGDSHRNEALYQAGLRLRGDFEAAGVRPGWQPQHGTPCGQQRPRS